MYLCLVFLLLDVIIIPVTGPTQLDLLILYI